LLSDLVDKRNSGYNTFYSLSTKKESDEEFAAKQKLNGSSEHINSQDEMTKKKNSPIARQVA
jgi:hypothetical protein